MKGVGTPEEPERIALGVGPARWDPLRELY